MRTLFAVCCALLIAAGSNAQGMKDPSTWTTRVVAGKGTYDLVFHVELQAGWHVWS